MAGESTIPFTPGSGGKGHSYQRTIGANAVDESVVIEGEAYLPSYVMLASNIAIATANDHILEVMAGSSLNVRIRRIHIEQYSSAGAATLDVIELWRLTSAGSGGGSVTAAPLDTGDNPAGATGMTLASSKGTEGTLIWRPILPIRSAVSATGGTNSIWEWAPMRGMKPLVIPMGTANGIAIKTVSSIATATLTVWVEFTESAFL